MTSLPELSMLFFSQPLYWREPLWLLLALQPVLLAGFRRLLHRQHLNDYADQNLHPWVVTKFKRTSKGVIFNRNSTWLIAWLLFAISAAGPRLATEIVGQDNSSARDIYIVVDVSRSMRVHDVLPSRIKRAQAEIEEFLRISNENNRIQSANRIGIIVYTAKPHLFASLTSDMSALRFYLDQLDSLTLPGLGSQPDLALQLAYEELQNSSLQRPSAKRAIIWMTDGDFGIANSREKNQTINRLQQSIDNLRNDDIALSVMGLGTTEGDAIQLENGQWLKHNGQAVISRMDEGTLKALTGQTDVAYTRVTDDDSDWQALYFSGIAQEQFVSANNLDDSDAASNNIIWTPLFFWTLFPAILFMFVAVTPFKFSAKNTQAIKIKTPAKISIVPTLFLVALLANITEPATASDTNDKSVRQAFEYFSNNNYSSAHKFYSRTPGYQGRFGEGASRYKMQDYNNAILLFSQAVLEADNNSRRAMALFNLGNSYFKTGQYAIAENIFADTLQYMTNHTAAQHNRATSLHFKNLVEKRFQQTVKVTNRGGRGPQTAQTDRSISINQPASVSELAQPNNRSNNKLFETGDNEDTEAMIQKGLKYIRLASSNSDDQTFTPDNVVWKRQLAPVRIQTINEDHSKLWKRLFEIEEGLDAPAEQPRIIEGINPW